jgi:hypothetical protein
MAIPLSKIWTVLLVKNYPFHKRAERKVKLLAAMLGANHSEKDSHHKNFVYLPINFIFVFLGLDCEKTDIKSKMMVLSC